MAGIYFKESQKFRMGLKWIAFIVMYILMFWSVYDQIKESKGDYTSVIIIIFTIVVIAVFNIIILIMKLETEIDRYSIRIQFKPFHIKPKIIELKDIKEIYIREYSPIREYGGHGIQRKMGNGRSYTVSGRTGLQIILQNGKKILIGTHKPKELGLILEKLKE